MYSATLLPHQLGRPFRRHPLALSCSVLLRLLPGLALVSGGVVADLPPMIIGGVVAAIALPLYAWAAWRVFLVFVHADRVVIRRLRAGELLEEIYPLPGRQGMLWQRSPLDRLLHTSSMTIFLPGRAIRLTMLQPCDFGSA